MTDADLISLTADAPEPSVTIDPAQPVRLYLIDGSGYIFRAFHALPPLTRKTDGLPLGAVAGFCNMLWKFLCEMKQEKPTHLAVIFDSSEKTFRNELYDQYKAHRPPPPEDLIPQFPLVREATRAFGVPAIELEGYEADDLIASYAKAVADAGGEVIVVSSDKDLMQLVTEQISILDPVKQLKIGRNEVIEKFGMGPERVVEIQALAGDSVDNVPGAPGIGIKTAVQLLTEFGDLDSLLARASEIKQPKKRETLLEFADQVRLSRQLVRLADDAPLPMRVDELTVRDPDAATLAAFLEAMEFRTLARRVAEGAPASQKGLNTTGVVPAKGSRYAPGLTPTPPPAPILVPFDPTAYACVTEMEVLDAWIARATAAGVIGFDTETASLSSDNSELCGVSLAVGPGEACYIPVGHCKAAAVAGGLDFGGAADNEADGEDWRQLNCDEALAKLKTLLEDSNVLKVGQNAKYDMAVLARYGIDVAPIDDTMLISYVLEGGLHGHGMDELAQLHLGYTPIPFKQVAGTGQKQISFAQVELKPATAYAAEDADVTLRLHGVLKPRLVKEKLATVYETLERPLPAVLAQMELAGIAVDPERLRQLGHEFSLKMVEFEAEAHRLASRPFNLGSPKQIGDILFGEMGVPGAKKTATGAWATDVRVLDDLALQGDEPPNKLSRAILDWRQMAKLKNTYTDALVAAVSGRTGRVHTSFSLAASSTGRLASSDPNLQNIPIRTEEGRKLRTCFIAEPGNVLISADYSQIELRLLADIGDIEQLKAAFRNGLDIHAMTASEMFGVPIEGMPSDVRRRAKAINFGIVYGISAFGLSNQLGIEQKEAADYIKTYFERFPGIRAYMEATKAYVREHGYVSTIFGRKIHIPAIRGRTPAERSFGERAAINAPIQGAAADIIRRAMVRIPGALTGAGLSARMLLQVHDELVFEAPEAEAEAVMALAKRVMERAAEPAVALSVPLVVEARAAKNWDEAH